MENYDASRIKIIKNLTGGVPRTMIIIFQIFLDKKAEIFENLEYILDQVTPLYKHRMDDLTAQQQRVAHEIAIAWDGVTFEELQKKTRLKEEELRGYLLELDKAYFIDVNHVGTELKIYQLKERFFNIWYLMRNGRKKKKENIKWLIKFLEIWSTPDELKERVLGHIRLVQEGKMNPKGALYMGEALAYIVDNSRLEREILLETRNYLEQCSPKLAEEISRPSLEEIKANDTLVDTVPLNSLWNNIKNFIFKFFKIELNSKFASAYNNMGISYRKKGAYEQAIASFKKAIELNPKDASIYIIMGISYGKKGEYDQAIASYQKAIELDPKYALAYIGLSRLYSTQNIEKKESLLLASRAFELDKENIYVLHTYATVLLWSDNYDKSIEMIDTVLNKDGYLNYLDDMSNYFLLLMAKKEQKRLYELFEKYPKLKKEFKPVYYTLMYYMQDEYPIEYKRMGSELKETVEEMIAKVEKLAEKYR